MLVGVFGVVATLLGSVTTFFFQSRMASHAEGVARSERLGQERLNACSAFAGALTELKRGLVSLWLLGKGDSTEPRRAAMHAECDRLGARAEAALRAEAA